MVYYLIVKSTDINWHQSFRSTLLFYSVCNFCQNGSFIPLGNPWLRLHNDPHKDKRSRMKPQQGILDIDSHLYCMCLNLALSLCQGLSWVILLFTPPGPTSWRLGFFFFFAEVHADKYALLFIVLTICIVRISFSVCGCGKDHTVYEG